MPANDNEELLTAREVCELLKVKRPGTIYSLIKTDGFPLPIKLGRKVSRWKRGEVLAYIRSRRRSKGIAEGLPPTRPAA